MRRILPAVGAVIAALALGGCAAGPAATSTTAASAQPTTASHTPTATPTPAIAPAVLPADCAAVGTPASRATTVGPMALQSNGAGFTRPAPQGATLALGCDWFLAGSDTTGALLLISRTDPVAIAAFLPSLPADGFTCTATGGYPTCTKTTPNPQYPVSTVETVIGRGDVWIYFEASNIDGAPLLHDLIAQLWP